MSLKDTLRGNNQEEIEVHEEQKEIAIKETIKFILPVKEEEKPNIKPFPLYLEEEKKKKIAKMGKRTKRSINEVINYMIDFCLEHME